MKEQELYKSVIGLRITTEALVAAAGDMPPTIELCMFIGMLGAVLKILEELETAGTPINDPDEKSHPLGVTS